MKPVSIQREEVLDLISDEKEALAEYERLCARFMIPPDMTAQRVVSAKIALLENLLNGTLKIQKS